MRMSEDGTHVFAPSGGEELSVLGTRCGGGLPRAPREGAEPPSIPSKGALPPGPPKGGAWPHGTSRLLAYGKGGKHHTAARRKHANAR